MLLFWYQRYRQKCELMYGTAVNLEQRHPFIRASRPSSVNAHNPSESNDFSLYLNEATERSKTALCSWFSKEFDWLLNQCKHCGSKTHESRIVKSHIIRWIQPQQLWMTGREEKQRKHHPCPVQDTHPPRGVQQTVLLWRPEQQLKLHVPRLHSHKRSFIYVLYGTCKKCIW